MPSENKDKFNHDDDAAGYDRDVRDESNPIRDGYSRTLDWVASNVPVGSRVVDLGCGTGNLTLRLNSPAKLYCVDVSKNMISIARNKLAELPCEFLQADLLDCLAGLPSVDAVISTYAIHHLTANEKATLFAQIEAKLRPGGRAVFGDLMFESRDSETKLCATYSRSGRQELVQDIRDEFFWYIDESVRELEQLGFITNHQQFGELSWGILADKP